MNYENFVSCINTDAAESLMDDFVTSIQNKPEFNRVIHNMNAVALSDGRNIFFMESLPSSNHTLKGQIINEEMFRAENALLSKIAS